MLWLPKRRFIRRFLLGRGTFWDKRLWIQRIVYGSMWLLIIIIFVLFGVVPFIYRNCYACQRGMVFLNFVNWPHHLNFTHPEKYGMNNTRHFYIHTDQDVKLGVWHVLPESLGNRSLARDEATYDEALGQGQPIVLYMHGNSGSRATSHRVALYKMLSKLDYHVVAFDYRSYADSSSINPTEAGVVADAVFVYKWLTKRSKTAPIFVWGHSLGTGISSHALAVLAGENRKAQGLILEAPFNNLRDAIIGHPMAKLVNFLPWFEFFVVDPMTDNLFLFESDRHLQQVKTPVLILHAHDDLIVPFRLGERLYKELSAVRASNGGGQVELVPFDKRLKYGHKDIYKSPLLPGIIQHFVSKNAV